MPSGIQRDGLLLIIVSIMCCCCCTGAFTLSHLIGFILKLVDKTCQAYSMPLMEYSLDQHRLVLVLVALTGTQCCQTLQGNRKVLKTSPPLKGLSGGTGVEVVFLR
ncbi:hypothetical protein J4Q44_G00303240 [Coregonus suidteri]|uniref:Uncharacterized protein n=1 Tax=Coregonus suidteri TaxID=861788 RepID=A0AAN8L0R0_9TELE